MVTLKLRSLRWTTLILGVLNLGLVTVGVLLMLLVFRRCGVREKLPVTVASVAAAVRILSLVGTGIAQGVTAMTIVSRPIDDLIHEDNVFRRQRKVRYKRWLWWTRFGMVVTVLQFLGALYLMFIIVQDFSNEGKSGECFSGQFTDSGWKKSLVVFLLALVWLVVIIQCFTGSDVLRWRSFYATHDTAWKAHYREVFDHGIREALCCLGRIKYLSVLEEDEVYSVARLLGDLVAYRASGTGHLELLAGLALLQRHRQSPNLYNELTEAPEERLQEAAFFHQFAEAAYTGPLLDFGRNPILFPCAWLYRQGVLAPWSRNRRPVLEGDNWWRGHAAAFLKYVNLSPEALRRGRVSQTKREAAYFIVVLHDQRSIVIAVRGTETPEDLITDGLCRECTLSDDDLDGLINSNLLTPSVRQRVLSSFPHYGHSGIVESARELYMQIDGQPGEDDSSSKSSGFLSSLVGVGCECHGYNIRIVGHSLGGAVATLLGLRLYQRYPNIHVYSYGTLPCVDSVVAEACSDFVTSIIYNDEFSARLSVNSILRLRAAAITSLSDDSSADSAIICKLARRILHGNRNHENGENHKVSPPSFQPRTGTVEGIDHIYRRKHFKYTIKGGVFLCGHAVSCAMNMPTHHPCSPVMDDYELSSGITSEPRAISDKAVSTSAGSSVAVRELYQEEASLIDDAETEILKDDFNECNNTEVLKDSFYACDSSKARCFEGSDDLISTGDRASQMTDDPPLTSASFGETPEMFLPGLIIHIVPEQKSILPLWKSWRIHDRDHGYKAVVAKRESFKDIIVTPYMFLDHLPWRCHYAMQRVLKTRKARCQLDVDLLNGAHMV